MNLSTTDLDLWPTARLSRPASDEIREQTNQALRKAGYPSLRNVEICVHEGLLTLTGRVPTYYLKQVAQSIAMTVEGVKGIENQIIV